MTLNLGAAIAAISSVRTDLAQRTGCTEWDNGGIRAALISTEGAPGDVLAAACLAAGDKALQYPSERAFVMHWPKNATAGPRVSHNVACVEHPDHDMPCPACKARDEADALDAAGLAAAKAACLAEAAAKPYIPPAARLAARTQETTV